jgi:type VI secretion system FHA domain protein
MRLVRIRVEHREAGTVSEHEFTSSPVRVGRNPLNDLSLPYPFVSGWHAVIRFDDESARFFDLGSTNGTTYGGRRIGAGESAAFDAPVSLRIGDLDLVLSRDSTPGRAASPVPDPAALSPVPPERRSKGRWMRSSGTDELRAGAIDTDDPRGRATPRPDQTAHVPLGQVHQTMATLRPIFEEAREARQRYERELRARVSTMPVHLRDQTETFIRREFGDDGAQRVGGGGPVTALAEQVVPELAAPASTEEAERFLKRIRDVLEACAKGVVELQNGQEQFGNEMGVRAVKEFTPLHTAASANNVLEYLLDWRHGGPHRVQELVGVFADVMIHQVALVNGMVEGCRALLARLDPEEIERLTPGGWGDKSRAKWQTYVARYRELAQDKALVELLFGSEFGRAYAEVGGEQQAPRAHTE